MGKPLHGFLQTAIFAVMLNVVHFIEQENLALHKPAFQSSTFAHYIDRPDVAGKAVDGNKDDHAYHGYCSVTKNIHNPTWWAVDLQQRYKVDTVIITNRGDCCGERLSLLRIGTTDTSPEVRAPSMDSMTVCACEDAPLANGEIRAFPCAAAGRYLIILFEKAEHLQLCEVEVYGEPAPTKSVLPATMRPSMSTELNRCFLSSLTPAQQRAMFLCFMQCLHNTCCHAVSIDDCHMDSIKNEQLHFVKQH